MVSVRGWHICSDNCNADTTGNTSRNQARVLAGVTRSRQF
jgi:hypothetical protein